MNASIQNTCNKDSIINFTWQKFFEENDYFKSLFNVSIPACKQRGESLSHIWLKSDNHYIIKNFMNELKNAYLSVGTYKKISLNGITKPADLASLLTELEPGDLVEIEFLGNIKSEVLALLKEALNDFTMTVVVGKGHTARKIVLNLPPFTAVFISEYKEKMFNRIAATIDIKIEPKISDEDLFKLEILDSALKNNLQLTEETLSFLMDYLQNKHINSVIKLLADYLYLHSNILQPISSSQMKTIL